MNVDKARREAARQILDTFQSHGVEIKKQLLQEKVSQLQGLSLVNFTKNMKHIKSTKPNTKLTPTSVQILEDQVLIGAKSGEILVLDMELKQLQIILGGEPLRGPQSTRKHPFALDKKRVNLPVQESHSGSVYEIVSDDQKILTIGQDCIGNLRNLELESICTFINEQPSFSACITQEHVVIADGVKIRVYAKNEMAELFTLFGPTENITSVKAVPKQNAVILVSNDGSLRYFSLFEQSQLIYEAKSPLSDCGAINSQIFVACGLKGVYLFNNEKKTYLHLFELENCTQLASSDGLNCFVVAGKNFVKIFQISNDQLIEIDQIEVSGHVNSLSLKIIKNNVLLAICGGRENSRDRLDVGVDKSFVQLWSIGTVDQKKTGRFQQ